MECSEFGYIRSDKVIYMKNKREKVEKIENEKHQAEKIEKTENEKQ